MNAAGSDAMADCAPLGGVVGRQHCKILSVLQIFPRPDRKELLGKELAIGLVPSAVCNMMQDDVQACPAFHRIASVVATGRLPQIANCI